MSNDKQQQPAPAKRDWIPVKQVWFAQRVSLPGGSTVTTQKGDCTQANVTRWQIDYGPAHRMFRITYYTPDPDKEPEVRMYMEQWVQSWEAMPL